MKTKTILAAALVVAVGCTLAGRFIAKRPVVEKSATQNVARAPAPVPLEANPTADFVTPPTPAAAIIEPVKSSLPQPPQKQKPGKVAKAKAPIQDPDARVALNFVGADPMAEQYWIAAINDTSLPANERKDLIEDLNEDGLSDPKHPGPEDVPLIVSRLQLIEELAPYAIDQVNLDAFQEAQKDLVAMLNGQTVH